MAITPLPPADFTPTMGNYNTPGTFRFWCQKVLPLVYDDSLSYYELLCKVVDYLNKTMEDVNTAVEDVAALHDAYDELQTYVNTYFSSLDVSEEINNKLDEMAADGSLTALISPLLPSLIAAWLQENLTPTTPPIDKTLTIENAAADAKKVGRELAKTLIGTGTIFTTETLAAPYDDLNTVPFNEVVNYNGVVPANAPVGLSSGLINVVTISRSVNRNYTSASVQILMHRTTSQNSEINVYFRQSAGGSTSAYWTDWKKMADNADVTALETTVNALETDFNKSVISGGDIINSEEGLVAPYDDLNAIPFNTIINYQNYFPANTPSEITEGLINVVTLSRSVNRNYTGASVQILTHRTVSQYSDVNVYFRQSSGGSESAYWTDWKKMAGNADLTALESDFNKSVIGSGIIINSAEGLVAPYDDLNTIPFNTIINYQNYFPANAPAELTAGLINVVTLSRSINRNYTSVSVQILTHRTASQNSDVNVYFRQCTGGSASAYWTNWKKMAGQNDTPIFISPSIFSKIAVIGDSFASGISGETGGAYEYSWLQMMCREYGITGHNFARGGLTTRTWLTSQYGASALADAESCNLYFIALGINDSNPDDRNVPLGTISDMDETTLPDTFYGNMQAIRNAVLAKNPNAVFCYITPQRIGTRYTPYQDAVVAIANKYGTLLIDWRDVTFATSSWWLNSLSDTSHPRAAGYNAMMHAIVDLLNITMQEHMSYLSGYPNVINN